MNMKMNIGIDDLALEIPSLVLPIVDLAKVRGIEPDKLKYGLGLENMSVCDINEDVVSLASGAVIRLLNQNPQISPRDIGRIYVGTESSIDGSKPIGSYVHQLVNDHFDKEENVLVQTDVIDMTFACIGAVDAMHNSIYYLQANPKKVAIVVAADIANYDLESTGEYTQGAGAVAVLLKSEPRLMKIDENWGVAMKSEHDFFKPIRLEQQGGKTVKLHDEKPIFDGQFSNQTYELRITEAWNQLTKSNEINSFNRLIFHLPYAFHGRRIITKLLIEELSQKGQLDAICEEFELDKDDINFVRMFSKTSFYKDWLKSAIAPGEQFSSHMGNLYTASIFLSLMSALVGDISKEDKYLFFAYGSGSKAKVFSGTVCDSAKEVVAKWSCKEQLSSRQVISFDEYEKLRMGRIDSPFSDGKGIQHVASGIQSTNRFERTYHNVK